MRIPGKKEKEEEEEDDEKLYHICHFTSFGFSCDTLERVRQEVLQYFQKVNLHVLSHGTRDFRWRYTGVRIVEIVAGWEVESNSVGVQ